VYVVVNSKVVGLAPVSVGFFAAVKAVYMSAVPIETFTSFTGSMKFTINFENKFLIKIVLIIQFCNAFAVNFVWVEFFRSQSPLDPFNLST
jgi:hypothetical protein